MANLLTTFQCVMLKTRDVLEEGGEITPSLLSHLGLVRLYKNPYPEYESKARYPLREYELFCRRCKAVCSEESLCSASAFSMPCLGERVYMFQNTHPFVGGFMEVRVLEKDVLKLYPSHSLEDAIKIFQDTYNAFRVKAVVSPISGVKWIPSAEEQYTHIDVENLI